MKYDFIPKKLYPYIKALYEDHIEPTSDIPERYIKILNEINKNYKVYLDYYILHECYGHCIGNTMSKIKNRLFGKKYIFIPQHLHHYIDFNNLKKKKNNDWNDSDLMFYDEYCQYLNTDMKYFKLNKYIIKTPKNPKITLKEHISMLFGKQCIRF